MPLLHFSKDLRKLRSSIRKSSFRIIPALWILLLTLSGIAYGKTSSFEKLVNTSIVVTNKNSSGTGSLDQAIQDFISNGGTTTITFDPGLQGDTIVITGGYSINADDLLIDGDIDGDGQSDITLQSDATNHRFFSLEGTANLTFNHLNVIDFDSGSGGGVFSLSGGSLTLEYCHFNNNQTSNEGGVINLSIADLTIRNSIFSNNSSGQSGGVISQVSFNSSKRTVIENSLFYGNSTGEFRNGGAIYTDFITNYTLRHVTFHSNSAGFGGAIQNGGTMAVENCLFTANTTDFSGKNINGGYSNAGGNILGGEGSFSDNPADYYTDVDNNDFTLSTTSLAADQGDNSLTTAAGITDDLAGNPRPYSGFFQIADAGAYELQGDPLPFYNSSYSVEEDTLTFTYTFSTKVRGLTTADFNSKGGNINIHRLIATNDSSEYTAKLALAEVAVITPDTLFIDGVANDLAGSPLILQDTVALNVYPTNIVVTNNLSSGSGSLDEAIEGFASSMGVVDSITFDASLAGQTIQVTKAYGISSNSLVILGDVNDDSQWDITLQSDGGNHRFISVSNFGTQLTLSHLKMDGFDTNNDWGGVVILPTGSPDLIVEGCVLSNNNGPYGGSIYAEGGSVTIRQTIFSGNSADNWGGAISIYTGGATTIENCLFINNSAQTGGAIYGRNGANITLRHVTFSGNSSTANGGAIYNLNQLTAENSLFIANDAAGSGDHIQNDRTFSDAGGNIFGGEADVSNDVADYFTDAANGDFTLFGQSLAADAGDNALTTDAGIDTDLLGNPRPYAGVSQIADVGAYELQADPNFKLNNQWTGDDGTTDWNNAANWSLNVVPDANDSVTIQPLMSQVYPVIDQDIVIGNLKLLRGLSIPAGYTVTVNEDLINDATFTIETGASFLLKGNRSGTGTEIVQRGVKGQSALQIIGLPVENTTLQDLADQGVDYIFSYETSTDQFTVPALSTALQPGTGYFMGHAASSLDKTSSGRLQSGTGVMISSEGELYDEDLTISVANAGYVLVANPYAAAIDATAFFNANSNIVGGTAYLWNDGAGNNGGNRLGNYITVNSVGAAGAATPNNNPGQGIVSRTVADWKDSFGAMQGFFIEVSGDVTFNRSMQIAGDNADANFFRGENHRKKLRLSVNGEGVSDNLLIVWDAAATMDEDYSMDGKKFSGNEHIAFYTLQLGGQYAITALPLDWEESQTVQLGLDLSQPGTYQLNVDEMEEIGEDQEVLLFDQETGTYYDLHQANEITFSVDAGITESERFQLIYEPRSTDDTGVVTTVEDLKSDFLTLYGNTAQLTLRYTGSSEANVSIHTLTGQVLHQQVADFSTGEVVLNDLSLSSNRVYILRVESHSIKFIIQ